MLKAIVFAIVTFGGLIATQTSASAQSAYCYVQGVEGGFPDGALIYQYTAIGRHEGLDSLRIDCRGGTIYARTTEGEHTLDFALVEASMPPDGRIPMFVQPDYFIKFRARYLDSSNQIAVHEFPNGNRSVVVELTDTRSRIVAESRVARDPSGRRLDEQIGIPVAAMEVATPARPTQMIETAAAAAWTNVPFVRPILLPENMQRFHPTQAWERELSGRVQIGLVINEGGHAEEVTVLAQDREDRWRFGEAAEQVARLAQWPVVGPNGQAAPYRARVNFNFRLPSEAPPTN